MVQHEDGGLGGWSDALQFPEHIGYAPNIERPPTLFLQFGEMFNVMDEGKGKVAFTFGEYGPGGPRNADGLLSEDGSMIQADVTGSLLVPGRIQGFTLIGTRVAGDSCITPGSASIPSFGN